MNSMTAPVISIFSAGDYDAQVQRGAEVLQAGGLVVLPTETVYGAAGLLTHPDAPSGFTPSEATLTPLVCPPDPSRSTWPRARMLWNISAPSAVSVAG